MFRRGRSEVSACSMARFIVGFELKDLVMDEIYEAPSSRANQSLCIVERVFECEREAMVCLH